MTASSFPNAVSGPALSVPKIQLQSILSVGLATKPDAIALYTGETNLTYRDLDTASTNVAGSYLRLGVKPGDRIASLLPNSNDLLVHYLACFKIGLTVTPLNNRYTPPEIDHALKLSGASVLLAQADREADLDKLTVKPSLGMVSLGGTGTSSSGDRFLADFEDLKKEESKKDDLPDAPSGDAPAIVFFTSGTTGKPKGVTHTYDSYGFCATSLAQALNASDKDIIFPGSSYSHTAGFVFCMTGLGVGAQIVIAAAGTADIFLPLAREVKPTIGFFLPSLLLTMIRDETSTKGDGDKVPSNLQKECHALTGKYVCEAYGMSEAVPITIQTGDETDDKRSAIGKPAPGCSISIRDVKTKKELPHGENGRMWIKGPLVMQGYWGNPEATAETIVDGWLDTGDVVSIDKDGSGYIRFAGRQKQIIVHQGSNISPLEVEDTLMAHPAVDEAGVVGIPHEVNGENVRAYVTLKKSAENTPSEGELIAHCKGSIGYKSPASIAFLDTMPLNATGKVDRAALKKNDPTLA